jgi:hypothetical protein
VSGPLKRLAQALHRDESGAAMVEFVLVFPIQLFLSLAILQFAFVAKAHIIVEQAAFAGARAGAVADCALPGGHTDVAGWRSLGKQAAERAAARLLGVVTSGDAGAATTIANGNPGTGTPGTGTGNAPTTNAQPIEWTAGDGSRRGYSANRVQEAFGHLGVDFQPYPQDGYVACEITYDYTMMIPVANHFFARAQKVFWGGPVTAADYAGTPSQQRGVTVFRIKRVSFIPTPWTRAPR